MTEQNEVDEEQSAFDSLSVFLFYKKDKPTRYYKYHSEVDYLDEIEKISRKKWGAQGVGRLREVAVIKPTEVEVDPLFERYLTFFNFD